MRRRPLLLLPAFGACASRPHEGAEARADPASLPGSISCVPFARALSGIDLAGDAHQWWTAADGRYRRSASPNPGAVLVFRRTGRLPQGHLAVVVRSLGPREVLVTHANWGSGAERGRVTENQRVVDVSPRNDWSSVRVWHPGSGTLGVTVFPAHGFILPARAADPADLAARVPAAARLAMGTP
jgi:hypothetical protein